MYLKRLSGSVNEGNSSQFAICLLKAAAEKGHLPSQLYLGDLYFEGKKLPDCKSFDFGRRPAPGLLLVGNLLQTGKEPGMP